MGIRDIDTREDMVHGPQVVDGFAAVRHDNQRSLATQVVYEQLKERVDCECLPKVSGNYIRRTWRMVDKKISWRTAWLLHKCL
jgi:hypothetical protein